MLMEKLSDIRKTIKERGHHVLFITFNAKIIDGEININDPDNDIAEVRWADSQSAKELMPSLFERLKINSDINKTLAFYAIEGTQ